METRNRFTKLAECPQLQASALSRVFFLWSKQLEEKTERAELTEEGLWDILPEDRCERICPVFETNLGWQQTTGREGEACHPSTLIENKSTTESVVRGSLRHRNIVADKKHSNDNNEDIRYNTDDVRHRKDLNKQRIRISLWKVILKTFWKDILYAQSFRFIQVFMFWLTNPHFMSYLMEHTSEPSSSMAVGVLLSLALFLLLTVGSVATEHSFFTNQNLEIQIHSVLISAVYKKAIKLSTRGRKQFSIGEMTSLVTGDCEAISNHLTHINYIIFRPLHFFVVFYQLFHILGVAAIYGVIVCIIIAPISVYVAVKTRAYFDESLRLKDRRMKLLNEVLTGIRVLKLLAWEGCFGEKLKSAREEEVHVLSKLYKVKAFSVFTWNAAPYVVSVVMFLGYFYHNQDAVLTAKTAFAVVSLLNLLRYAINETPEIIFDFNKTNVAIQRLEKFLCGEDHKRTADSMKTNSEVPVEIEDGWFSWDGGSVPTLQSISLRVPRGGLVAVVGQVGAGKSSLIAALLGEITKTRGDVRLQGTTGYVSQQAWIQNDTVENNVLFGKPMQRQMYDTVVEACALAPDLQLMPAGDHTEIGEQGINLSGGQKQRVSLARAVYNDADIYLLDDPLSAVDSHVGKHIFHNVIGNKGLLKNKTRVLVTHNVRYLPHVDSIVVLEGGEVRGRGTFTELLATDTAFTSVLAAYLSDYDDNKEFLEGSDEEIGLNEDLRAKLKRLDSRESDTARVERNVSRQSSVSSHTDDQHIDDAGKCIEEEEDTSASKTSKMEKWKLFLTYTKAFGVMHMITIVTVYILYYVLWMIANIWLVSWTEDPIFANTTHLALANKTTRDELWRANMMYLSVYTGFGFIMSLCIVVYAVVMTWGVVQACRDLHHSLLDSILKAPVQFFDKTPIGRITSRFSQDLGSVDETLPTVLELWLDCILNISLAMFAVAYSAPTVLAVMLPVAVFYYNLQTQHSKRSGHLCSLESKAWSPVVSLFTESVMGADTVRAYRVEKSFHKAMELRIDNFHRMMFYSLLNHRWLGIHMLAVGNLVCAVSAMLRSVQRGSQSAGLLGLGTTFSVEINGCMAYFIILQSDLETDIIAIDRITSYINCPQERAWRCSKSRAACSWPEQGEVEFRHFSLRYRHDLQPVLTNISLTIRAGEKVGLVGRTGAGKSSLALSLFRLVEADSGSIWIDGINIADIGLHDLREKLSIIPQDPVLFTGTLRMNLDPEDRYSDEEITTALQHTHLTQFVSTLDGGINAECGEGGNNFSVGQRQLFCLTRTLLQKSKILVLDEATAAVDMETDDHIQKTIRSEFKDCTVLTIAHRLNTVMDYDRILVLDRGEVVEFDSPGALLHQKGAFYRMIQDAGLSRDTNTGDLK